MESGDKKGSLEPVTKNSGEDLQQKTATRDGDEEVGTKICYKKWRPETVMISAKRK